MQNQIEMSGLESELLAALDDVRGAITWDSARVRLCVELVDGAKAEELARVFNLYVLQHLQAAHGAREVLLACAGPMQ